MADKPIDYDEDRIVQFIPPPVGIPIDPMESATGIQLEQALDIWEGTPILASTPIPITIPLDRDYVDSRRPVVSQGDQLTCLKCGREWKSRRGGLKPCPACGDKEWWKEFDLAALEAIQTRLASQSSDLQPAPSSGRVNCRLVLEVYEPGTSLTSVGVYRKVGAGWPDGDGLGVLRFKVDEKEELMEIMALVKGVVNAR